MTTIYGIKNCDTMKKALSWLEQHDIDFTFHDYKKKGAPKDVIAYALKACGWENVINRKGMTWRKLPDSDKEAMNEKAALQTALDNPSIIKRPLLIHNGQFTLGFKEEEYAKLFA